MPKFTESKTDRAYEGFDENDVHFVCRPNEIGYPVSSGTHRRPGLSRKIRNRRNNRKGPERMIFRNDKHGVLFEKEIRYHKGCRRWLRQVAKMQKHSCFCIFHFLRIAAALFGA